MIAKAKVNFVRDRNADAALRPFGLAEAAFTLCKHYNPISRGSVSEIAGMKVIIIKAAKIAT